MVDTFRSAALGEAVAICSNGIMIRPLFEKPKAKGRNEGTVMKIKRHTPLSLDSGTVDDLRNGNT